VIKNVTVKPGLPLINAQNLLSFVAAQTLLKQLSAPSLTNLDSSSSE
jgi:hypothetical protein